MNQGWYLEEGSGLLADPDCFVEGRRDYVNLHSCSFLDAQTCIDLRPPSDVHVDESMEVDSINRYLQTCSSLARKICIPPCSQCQCSRDICSRIIYGAAEFLGIHHED